MALKCGQFLLMMMFTVYQPSRCLSSQKVIPFLVKKGADIDKGEGNECVIYWVHKANDTIYSEASKTVLSSCEKFFDHIPLLTLPFPNQPMDSGSRRLITPQLLATNNSLVTSWRFDALMSQSSYNTFIIFVDFFLSSLAEPRFNAPQYPQPNGPTCTFVVNCHVGTHFL